MDTLSRFKLLALTLIVIPLYLIYKDIGIKPHLCKQLQTKERDSCMRRYFNDILLIIVFNSPLYSTVPILYDLYKEAFPFILICGPEADQNFKVVPADINKGIFGYDCIAKAMETQRKYHGYLVVNDDLILNFWNLDRFDKNKIWEGPKSPVTVEQYSPPKKWYWWTSRWGMKNCQRAFDEVYALKNDSADSKETGNEFIETLEINGKGGRHCYRGRSDIFYIPAQFSVQFQILSNIFRKHEVFLEITIPTILRCLSLESNFEALNGIYLPGKKGQGPARDSTYFWTYYREDIDFIHPLKLHYPAYKEMNVALIENWIKKTAQRWTSCNM